MSERTDPSSEKYAGYSSILRQDSFWQPGVIKLPDNSAWTYLEPGAQIAVRRKCLQIRVAPFTRSHDSIQTLDNSKHLYFSKATYSVARDREMEYAVSMSAKGLGTAKGDFFDGFVAFHLLDAQSGIAADFFAADENLALAYSRPKDHESGKQGSRERKYLANFKELEVPTSPGELHRYTIRYIPEDGLLVWTVDGRTVAEEKNVPVLVSSFRIGVGVMTAKNITNGKSVSVHGQGIVGQWSPIRISKVAK